ncbi:MAG: ATP-binding cassette domain-containing protein, partial [Rubrivivax sp.]|nr:ATP-binding cassette domain-containing protein [Rubrivivax sp.]
DFTFEFTEPQNLPNPMLAMSDASFGYPPPDEGSEPTVIVRNISRSVLAGQRIGILGANGQGKSTLVKTIAGDLPLVSGQTTQGKGLVIGYFAQQELDVLHLDDGPLMHMVRLARDVGPPAREQELRDFLGSFRFVGEMVQQAVGSLSGGEKARLVLAMLVWQRPNLLLMDEPTNHLDLTTREALSIALNEFEGTVMLVSHDRALLRETCDEFWLVAKGRVEPFDGDLDDYQKWLLEVSRANARGQPIPDPPRAAGAAAEPAPPPAKGKTAGPAKAAAPAPAAPVAKPAAPKPATRDDRQSNKAARIKQAEATRPLRNELLRIDERLAKLGQEKAEIEAALSKPDANADGYAELGRRLAHVAAEVAMLEERWIEAQTELEVMQSA